jgi:Matrixin
MFRSKEAISFSFPPGPHEYNGDMIFNGDIRWKIDGSERDILKRIVYEIGIVLGLQRTDRATSVMNPKKKGFSRQLDELDRQVREKGECV